MLNHILPSDTQAILLLCASFGQNRQTEPQPLALSEYNVLAGWLLENEMTPGDLLNLTLKNRLLQTAIGKLDSHRLAALLERGVMLSLAVEKWTNQGLWVLGRSDSQYPKCLKKKLKHSAPAILYGVGSIELLNYGGLAIVGSRDVDEAGLKYTQRIVETCAKQDIQVISGGARGVDQASMLGVLAAGGTAVGVLADSLAKAAVAGKYRTRIKEGRLTLISAYDPDTAFNVGNAMGRNKYIYALSDYALVISCSVEQGGTWAGAVEAIDKIKDVPVFVRIDDTALVGNQQLLNKGAKPFPQEPWNEPIRELLQTTNIEFNSKETEKKSTAILKDTPLLNLASDVVETKPDLEAIAPKASAVVADEPVKRISLDLNSVPTHKISQKPNPKDIYEAVLPFIIAHLEQPKDAKSLAECLNVRPVQMQDWLDRAVAEGKVRKNKKPVTYEINQAATLLSLLEKMK